MSEIVEATELTQPSIAEAKLQWDHLFELIIGKLIENLVGLEERISSRQSTVALVTLSRISKTVNRAMRNCNNREWLYFLEEIEFCKMDGYQVWPVFLTPYVVQAINSYLIYGGKSLIGIYLSLPLLYDKTLEVIAENCKVLKQFEVSIASTPRWSNGLATKTFTNKGLLNFFQRSSPLTHLGIHSTCVESNVVIDKLFTRQLFDAIADNHPLEVISMSINRTMMERLGHFLCRQYKKFHVQLHTLNFADEDDVGDDDTDDFSSDVVRDNMTRMFQMVVKTVPQYFSNLKILILQFYQCDSDLLVGLITPLTPQLSELRLQLCRKPSESRRSLTTNGMRTVTENCRNLTKVNFTGHALIQTSDLVQLLTECRKIVDLTAIYTSIDLEDCLVAINKILAAASPYLLFFRFSNGIYNDLSIQIQTLFPLFGLYPHVVLYHFTEGRLSRPEVIADSAAIEAHNNTMRLEAIKPPYHHKLLAIAHDTFHLEPNATVLNEIVESVIAAKEENKNRCPMCSEVASFRCSRCNKVYYCSRDHQKMHWQLHKVSCK